VTAAAGRSDGSALFTASEDGVVVQWALTPTAGTEAAYARWAPGLLLFVLLLFLLLWLVRCVCVCISLCVCHADGCTCIPPSRSLRLTVCVSVCGAGGMWRTRRACTRCG
jgi:hypothetical protein